VVGSLLKGKKSNSKELPMISSNCPAWVCYAEKTQANDLIGLLSTTKSPQQIMGSLVKYYFSKKFNKSPDQIYHVTIMPCYDKKIEAAREENCIESSKEVDCVLVTTEIMKIFEEKRINITTLDSSPIPNLLTNIDIEGKLKGIDPLSDGYLEFIFKFAAKELYNVNVEKLDYKYIRNKDFKTAALTVNGEKVLNFALVCGLKNIQNILRLLKRKQCQYDFIEIMACPGGCGNGSGQINSEVCNPNDPPVEADNVDSKLSNVSALEFYEEMGLTNEILKTKFSSKKKVESSVLNIDW